MPRLSQRSSHTRPSGGDRVFTDASGRLWSAVAQMDGPGGVTVIFTCITDGRQSGRALVVELPDAAGGAGGGGGEVGDIGDELLRAWLEAAPRIGRLT